MGELNGTTPGAGPGSLLARIDDAADAFEAEWQRHSSPSIAAHLGTASGEERRALLEELVHIDLEYRWRAGDPRILDDYAREFPELLGPRGEFSCGLIDGARRVREWFPHEAAPGPGAPAPDRDGGAIRLRCPQCRNPISEENPDGRDVTCSSCGHTFRLAGPAEESGLGADLPRRLGPFLLVGVLGRGTFGTVYKAHDDQLGRWVAIKVSRTGSFGSAEVRARFLREARSAAELNHPHIVPVHAIAHEGDVPYIVSEYIEGPTLADALDRRRFGFRETAELVARLAEALDYAHRRKIVHRDITPRNVLIDPAGLPHLTDFGLAQRQEASVVVTLDGEVLGTPAYMAPEQAAGHSAAVDGRSDIYGLGVILYQMLAGELPFRGTVRMLLHQVVHEEPRSPRRFNDRIPYDLETICLKAMAKSPSGRYATAGEFAADLRRYLAGEPILARRASWWERCRKWVRRQPTQAAAALAVSLAVACLVLALWYGTRLRATEAVAAAEIRAAREVAATQEYYSLVTRVREARARPQPGWTWTGLASLRQAAGLATPARNPVELRSEAAACLEAFDLREAAVLARGLIPYCLAFSPDGKHLAIGPWRGGADCSIPIYEVDSSRLRCELAFPPSSASGDRSGAHSLAFSPDGYWLVAGTPSGEIHAWDLGQVAVMGPAQGQRRTAPHSSWIAHRGELTGLAFNPDGTRLVSCSVDKRIKAWDPSDRWREVSCLLADRRMDELSFSADGRLLACSSPDGWRFADVARSALLPAGDQVTHTTDNQRVGFSRDGSILAVSDQWGITLIDPRLRRVIRELRDPELTGAHEDDIAHLHFNADGSLLVSGAHDRKIKVWEVASGRMLAAITTLGVGNIFPVFSPDGRFLAATGNRQTILYEIHARPEHSIVAPHPYPVRALDFSPDGETLACLAEETGLDGPSRGEVTLWDLTRKRVNLRQDTTVRARRDSRSPASVAYHPSGSYLAYSYGDAIKKTFHFLDLKTGERSAPGVDGKAVSLSFSRDGRTLWSAGTRGNRVASWRVPDLSRASVWSNADSEYGDGRTSIYCVSAGRGWVIAGSWDGTVKRLRESDGALESVWPCPGGPVFCVALSHDENGFAAGAQNGSAYVVDVRGQGLVAELKGHRDSVDAVSFRGDGQLLATGSRDGTVRLWQRADGSFGEVLALPAPGPVVGVTFSPDGRRLAVLVKNELAARLWDLAGLRERLSRMGLSW